MRILVTASLCAVLLSAPAYSQDFSSTIRDMQRAMQDRKARLSNTAPDPSVPYTPQPGWPCGIGAAAASDKDAYYACEKRQMDNQSTYVTPTQQMDAQPGKPVPKPSALPLPSKRGQSVEF